VSRLPNDGRVVTWRYSDAPSGEGVGLRITQRSFDAPSGENYVLFRFTIRNGSNGRRTINPGVFMDFDIDEVFLDDVGRRQGGGKLLSVTSTEDASGIRAGTLMLGESDATPGYFFNGDALPPTISQQVAILRGNRTNSPATQPNDVRYFQSVRAIGLSPGAQTDLWVAVIAAPGDAAFADAADAAARDIGERRQRLLAGAAEPAGAVEWSSTTRATAPTVTVRQERCGKDCMLRRTGQRFPGESRQAAGLQQQRSAQQ
jgi:hypothetical protein